MVKFEHIAKLKVFVKFKLRKYFNLVFLQELFLIWQNLHCKI